MRDVVLVGGGHSHVLLLRGLVDRPWTGARLTLVSDGTETLYSGMLPGCIAGLYRWDEARIDLRALCRAAGAAFVQSAAVGIDRIACEVRLADGGAVPYELMSLDVGAVPQMNVPGAAEHAVAAKPFLRFKVRWTALLERALHHHGPLTVVVVGAGAAGVELALAVRHRLEAELRSRGRNAAQLRMHLVSAGEQLLPGHNAGVRRQLGTELRARGIVLHLNERVAELRAGTLRTASGLVLQADEIIWATGAGAPAWLRDTGLALDEHGFVQVDARLRSVNDERIFAAGDVASLQGRRVQKAGAVAVHQAPVLAHNLRAALAGQALRTWRPKPHWLALIGTGGRHAVASRGGFSASGRWVWLWKDWLDRRFMRKFDFGS
ncbi:MAG: FAD-dependent oxidoreductase [Pseudomonadota bacterium]